MPLLPINWLNLISSKYVDPFLKYLNANGIVIDESDKGYTSEQIDYAISIFATCTNCTIDISGTNAHRTAASNGDLNTLLANGNTITLNDVLGAELHTSLNAANDSATQAITAFSDYSATIDGATKVDSAIDFLSMIPQGAELVINGDFSAWTGDNPDGWALLAAEDGANYVTEDSGKANIVSNGGTVGIRQTILTTGKYYIVTIDVTDVTSGSVYLMSGDPSNKLLLGTAGSFTWVSRADSTIFYIARTGACDITIDNVSVKELQVLGSDLVTNGTFTGDTNWIKGDAAWTLPGTVASCDGTQVAEAVLSQAAVVTVGSYYLMKATITRTAGSVQMGIGSTKSAAISAGATVSFVGQATSVTSIGFYADADFAGTIDNVSIHALTLTKAIAGSVNYTGSHYILPVDANDFAIPKAYVAESIVSQKFSAESNLTTGFTAANNAVLSSVTTPKNVGNFAISVESNTTPTADADCDIDFTVDNASVYRLSVDWRHIGTGLDWELEVEGVQAATRAVGNTTYVTKVYYFLTGDTTATVRFKEANASNNGGLVFDNLKLQKVTLS